MKHIILLASLLAACATTRADHVRLAACDVSGECVDLRAAPRPPPSAYLAMNGTPPTWLRLMATGVTLTADQILNSTADADHTLGWVNPNVGYPATATHMLRYAMGDLGSAMQCGTGDRLQIYAYHGIDITAARNTLTPPVAVTGGNAADGVTLTGGTAGVIAASALHANANLVIGSTGTAIAASFTGTTTGTPAVGANACAPLSSPITVTGATAGAPCVLGYPTAYSANLVGNCFVTSANTVQIRWCNPSASAGITPTSGTYTVRVFQ